MSAENLPEKRLASPRKLPFPPETTARPGAFRVGSKTREDRILDWQALGSWAVIAALNRTLRFRTEGTQHLHDARSSGCGGIILAWHGTTIVPVDFLRGLDVHAMASLSRDGEYVHRLFTRFGWKSIRGSTNEGGSRVVREAMRKLRAGALIGITPDGPRGPAGTISAGTIYLASRTQAPVLPMGVAALRRHHLRTWDRYVIPYPFTAAAVVFGQPVFLPKKLERQQMPELKQLVRECLVAAGRRAEHLLLEAS